MDDIKNEVLGRLESLGVIGINAEDSLVNFSIGRAEERILNDINCSEIPNGLFYTFVDMVCGYYLHDAKSMGRLQVLDLDFSAAPATEIKEGDVQIKFAAASDGSLTPEARLDRLIESLIHPAPALLARYRRLTYG